jgi:hypothetical protein
MSAESESRESQAGEAVVCPKCLLANSPTAAFCVDCGAPIGMVAAVDPLQHIYAEGFAYRSAVDGPPNLIVLVGMWLIFAPIVFATPLLVFGDFIRAFSPRLLFFSSVRAQRSSSFARLRTTLSNRVKPKTKTPNQTMKLTATSVRLGDAFSNASFLSLWSCLCAGGRSLSCSR